MRSTWCSRGLSTAGVDAVRRGFEEDRLKRCCPQDEYEESSLGGGDGRPGKEEASETIAETRQHRMQGRRGTSAKARDREKKSLRSAKGKPSQQQRHRGCDRCAIGFTIRGRPWWVRTLAWAGTSVRGGEELYRLLLLLALALVGTKGTRAAAASGFCYIDTPGVNLTNHFPIRIQHVF